MVPIWLGGAPHNSPPPNDPGSILLTSTTAARWRFLGHNARGDGDTTSESTPSAGMVFLFSFFV